MSVPIESPYATLLVMNTNLHPVSHRFEVIADYFQILDTLRFEPPFGE